MGLLSRITQHVRPEEELRLLSLAIDGTDRAIMVLDEDRRIVYVNRAFTDIFGYHLDEIIGQRPTNLLAGKNTDPVTIERIRRRAQSSTSFQEEVLFYSKEGHEIWVSGNTNPIRDANGDIRNLVVVLSDISDTKHVQALQRTVLESVAAGVPLAEVADLLCRHVEAIAPEVVASMTLIDADRKIQPLAGPSLSAEYSAALAGQPIGNNHGSCGTAAWLEEPVCGTDIETDPLWRDFKHLALPQGLLACWSSPIKLHDGHIAGTFAFYYREKREPSLLHKELVSACLHLCILAIERDAARRHIAKLSHFDALTGLPNRATLHDLAADLLERSRGKSVTFFAIDIDHFKDINNGLGHLAGDKLLIEIAYRLQRLSRPSGIAGRIDGNSFAIVMPDCGSSLASILAESILEVLHAPFPTEKLALSISASIGIAVAQDDNAVAQVMIEQAINAMQQAKSNRRASYRFYSPEIDKLAQDRLILGASLREALAQNTLRLHYQPQFHLKTMELVGVEALTRWTDPQFGEVPPSRFIPLAEEIGQIEALGHWSLREACRQIALWRSIGIAVPCVSVNLSPAHFRSSNLPCFVQSLLRQYNLQASSLTIEITENIMMDNCPESLKIAMSLHEMGVGLSMDDFGTGFSSLAGLARLPITELKLDHSFMSNFESNANAQAVATAVIRIGQSLGMTVVAEGVETAAQARILTNLGCDIAQGYLYGYPMPPADLEQWIESK